MNHISEHLSGSMAMCSLSVILPNASGASLGPKRSTHHANGSDMMFLNSKVLKTTTNTNATPS